MASAVRISTRPGHHIEVPPVRRHPVTNLNGEVLEFGFGELEPAPLPAEFFLRELADLEASDVDELVVFSQDWGALAHLGDDPLAFLPTARYPIAKPYARFSKMAAATAREYPHRAGTRFIAVPILQLHVQILKTLTRHWLQHACGGDGASLAAAWEDVPIDPQDGTQAWKLFFEHLDHGLQHFSPHVWSPEVDWEPPKANLYMACCLQIYNHIAERADYRICANGNCRRPFALQRGRSVTGPNRTRGVKYCSPECAKATAQRKYARRKRGDRS